MTAGLPLVSPEGLDRDRLEGFACAGCGKRWPVPCRPCGITPASQVLRACEDCMPELLAQ